MRDITPRLAREQRLPGTQGVWLDNVGPSGPCGQAEPELRPADVLVSVNGEKVADIAELQALTRGLWAGAKNGKCTVMAGVRRAGSLIDSVVELRTTSEREITPRARKAWLGAASQPLTTKLAARLGLDDSGGVRLTRVYPGTQAEAAGLRVGDVVLALDNEPVAARREDDADLLERMVRQYRPDTPAIFSLWRDGKKTDLAVVLETQPTPPSEMPWWEDEQLEFAVHDLAFDDRVRLQLGARVSGVLVENAALGGWAALAGLHADDVVIEAGGRRVANVAELRAAREGAVHSGRGWWVLLVQRGDETEFVEINLKPAKS
jgi:serine protease Do